MRNEIHIAKFAQKNYIYNSNSYSKKYHIIKLFRLFFMKNKYYNMYSNVFKYIIFYYNYICFNKIFIKRIIIISIFKNNNKYNY